MEESFFSLPLCIIININCTGQIQYTHWAARGITAVELYYGQKIKDIRTFNHIVPQAWWNPDYTKDCGNMMVIALIMLVLSYAMMLFRNRRVVNRAKLAEHC